MKDEIIKILNSLNIDFESNYFQLDKETKEKFISLLWDELYQLEYLRTFHIKSQITSIEYEYLIISHLNEIKENVIENDMFEYAEILKDLINITQAKFNQLRNYASSKNG